MSIFLRNDGFVTNGKFDCERTRNKEYKRASRRMYGTPMIKGPVYVNRMQTPIKPPVAAGADKKEEGGILKKIGAFFSAAGAMIVASFKTPIEPDPSINEHYSESDIAFIRSLDDSANVYFTDYEAKAALRRFEEKEAEKEKKQAPQSVPKQPKMARFTADNVDVPSILDIKSEVESAARKEAYDARQNELIAEIRSYESFFPKGSAFEYISLDDLDKLSNKELEEILDEIRNGILKINIAERKLNKRIWVETEEYLLFENNINVDKFISMVNSSGKNIVPSKDIRGLLEWKNFKNGTTADYRDSSDVVHNSNLVNLKIALHNAYLASCEDGGKLDHDPVLEFPNGSKTRLSSFIGNSWFDELSEPDAKGRDIKKVKMPLVAELKSA